MAIKIPLRLLNIEGDGYHLQAKIRINGKPAVAIVDTGASRTVFDKAEIAQYLKTEEIGAHDRLSTGLGTSSMQSHFVVLGSLSLGKLKLENFDSVVLDLQHVNQTYRQLGFETIAGVIGSDVLVALNAVIDFRSRVMTLYPKKHPASTKRKVRRKATRKPVVKRSSKKKAAPKKTKAAAKKRKR
jgi:hypothetical protein